MFKRKGLTFTFEGICLAIRKKNLGNVNTTFILRNVLTRVGVELIISYYIIGCIIFLLMTLKEKILDIKNLNFTIYVIV